MQVQGLSNAQSVLTQLTPDATGTRAKPAPVDLPQVGTSSAAVVDAAQAAKHQTTDPAEVRKAVDTLNKAVLNLNNGLQFSVDQDTKIDVVRVVDLQSQEVVRQIPSVEVLSIARAIDKLQGMLIKDKA